MEHTIERSQKVDLDIFEYLRETSNTEAQAEERYGVSQDDVIDIMIEKSYERCNACGYWLELCELEEDDMDHICLSCK